jgi:hypothetical protein
MENHTAAVALHSLTHPVGKVGVLFLKVLWNRGFELFPVYPFARAGLLPDHFTVLAVEELRRCVCKDFDENWFGSRGSQTYLCHRTSQVLSVKPFLGKAAVHCDFAQVLGFERGTDFYTLDFTPKYRFVKGVRAISSERQIASSVAMQVEAPLEASAMPRPH